MQEILPKLLPGGRLYGVGVDPMRASCDERRANPHSTSAKLRWAVMAWSPDGRYSFNS